MAEKQLPSTVYNHFRNVRLFKEQELGHGSFATVCRVQCDDLPCAAKVLHAGFFDQQDPDPGEQNFIQKFIEECKILPSITHPNIVQCFGTYQDPDTDLPVLLMELMDESLTDYIEHSRDPLPYHIEVSFSYDIALGLSCLHSRGYVHRDLSSNNVLIMAGTRAKITDFGMCRAMTGPSYRQTRLTLCPGTHPFMPPEALVDPPTYTDKLDIFSLGVIMIQLMSRLYPNPGPAHRQVQTMLLQAIPEEERRSNHIKLIHQSHQMLPLIKQCIQNSHHKRPSSHDVCNNLKSLKESYEYHQSKDQASVERKLEKAVQLHEAHCQKLQARHEEEIAASAEQYSNLQEQIAVIKAAHSQELTNVHSHYRQQLRQLQHSGNLTPPMYAQRFQAPMLPPPSQGQIPPHLHESYEKSEGKGIKYSVGVTITDSPTAKGASVPFDPLNLPEPAFDTHDLEMFHKVPFDPLNLPEPAFDTRDLEMFHQVPFDPLNLPEPAFDTRDLEMFHQEGHKPNEAYVHGMHINPHLDNFDDFIGSNLDNHLAYHSHDSGHTNLDKLSMEHRPPIPQLANSPSRSKPNIVPHRNAPRSNRCDEPSITLSHNKESTNLDISSEDATTAICTSSPNFQESSTIIDDEITSNTESGNLLYGHEAHTSLESSSPHQSLESKPSMSDKSSICSSTPEEETPSASSGRKLVFLERNTDGYVDITLDGKESSDALTSLDSQSRPREQAAAFTSAKSDKRVSTSDKSKITYDRDLAFAKPCWYCTNLTSLKVCDVCGNYSQKPQYN